MARPRQISDEQILTVTRDCVLSDGPAVSLDAIAGKLGVTGPALLKRFKTRQALLIAALKPPDVPQWAEDISSGPTSAPLEEQLVGIFTQVSDFMATVMPCITALRESGIPHHAIFGKGMPGGPLRGFEALHQWLLRAKERGLVTAPELESAALALLGALQTRSFFTHVFQRRYSARSDREYILELASFFSRALCTPPKKSRRRST